MTATQIISLWFTAAKHGGIAESGCGIQTLFDEPIIIFDLIWNIPIGTW